MTELSNSQTGIVPAVQVPGKPFYFFCKRLLDIAFVLLALPLLLPLLLIIALLIRRDSSGPVIFSQERVGVKRYYRDGTVYCEQTPFHFYKFRTMKANAAPNLHRQFIEAYINGDEAKMSQMRQNAESTAKYKLLDDPRITKVGQFLRKSSLDELPQLFNVLKGDMSLVGPRPPIPYEVEMYKHWHRQRLTVIPGITGYWQISGRGTSGFDDMVKMDLAYIDKQNLLLDMKILLKTIPAVIKGKGAR